MGFRYLTPRISLLMGWGKCISKMPWWSVRATFLLKGLLSRTEAISAPAVSRPYFSELVRSHNRAGTKERIHNFLAWPIWLRIDRGILHEYMDEMKDYRLMPPADLRVEPKTYVGPDDMPGRYIWSRSLTEMRSQMNDQTAARVLLGGQVSGFKGKYPGLLEEALFALRAKKPLYLVGGLEVARDLLFRR